MVRDCLEMILRCVERNTKVKKSQQVASFVYVLSGRARGEGEGGYKVCGDIYLLFLCCLWRLRVYSGLIATLVDGLIRGADFYSMPRELYPI